MLECQARLPGVLFAGGHTTTGLDKTEPDGGMDSFKERKGVEDCFSSTKQSAFSYCDLLKQDMERDMGQVVVYLFNRECCLQREWPESLPILPTILVHFQIAGSKVKK